MSRVAVAGPGALGCLFAASLARSGITTWLIDHNQARATFLRETGITVESNDGGFVTHPEVGLAPPEQLDLFIVLTKSYATSSVILPAATPVLTLQNGLGNAEILETRCGPERVLAGATWEAVTWLAPGRVRHVASGKTVFGSWKGCPGKHALDLLCQAGFNAAMVEDPRAILWEKMIINAAINPLAAVLNVRNGALLEHPESRALLHALAAEAAAVARAEGHGDDADVTLAVERACEATGDNISSMLQDIRNRKATEIEAISGEIMRRAADLGIPAPNTTLAYHLVRAMESI